MASTVQLTLGTVDVARRVLVTDEGVVRLTTRECELLAYLADRAGKVVDRSELLTEVWGYAPSVVSRAVDSTAIRLRGKIERDAANPDHLMTHHGVGYQLVLSAPAADQRAMTPTAPDLPRHADRFVGREPELDAVDAALAAAQVVTLLGPAGAGKTRCSLEIARRWHERGEPVLVASLVSARTRAEVVAAFATAMGGLGRDATLELAVARIGAALKQLGPALLVVDNAEQVVDETSRLLGGWLASAPQLKALVTSRERLRIRGERVVALDALSVDEAVELFCERAAAQGRRIPESEQQGVVRRLVEELDRMPLAIELAAGRSGMIPLPELLAGLDDRLSVLVGWERDRDARQQSLRGALDWSWDLLTADERMVFRRCAVLHRTFQQGHIEALVRGELSSPVDHVVRSLVDKSMLWARHDGTLQRLGLYVNLRAYAAEKLAEASESEAISLRHAHALTASIEPGAVAFEQQGAASLIAPLARERDALIAIARELPDSAIELRMRALLCIEWLLRWTMPRYRALALLERAGPGELAVPDALRARWLLALGRLYDMEQPSRALEYLDGAAELLAPEQVDLLGAVLCERAESLQELGRTDEARAAWGRALELARGSGSPEWLLRMALVTVSTCLTIQGRFTEAMPYMAEGVGLARRAGDSRRLARLEQVLGIAHLVLGDADASIEHSERSIALYDALGMPDIAANPLGTVGNAWLALECFEDALECYREAKERHLSSGAEYKAVLQSGNIGWVLMERGDLDGAERTYTKVVERLDELNKPRNAAIARGNRAVLFHQRGDTAKAAREFDRAVATLDAYDDRHPARFFRTYLARALADLGELDRAESVLDVARGQLSEAHDQPGLRMAGMAAAHVALARGDTEAARAELQAAELALDEARSDVTADLRVAVKLLRERLGG